MICPVCGAQNEDGSQVCLTCGAPLTPADQSPAGPGYPGQQPNYAAAPGAGQQSPAGPGYPGQQPNYGAATGAGQQSPAGYGYSGQQPNYGAAPGAGQPGPAGYGYPGQQPNYGAAPGAGQPGPAGYGYPGQQPSYGAAPGPMGQQSPGYGYGGAQTAYAPAPAKKKSIVPIIAIIAVVAVAVVAVYFLFLRGGSLVGTWSYEEDGYVMLFTFKKDGSGEITMEYDGVTLISTGFEWKELSGNRLQIANEDGDKLVYEYSVKGDTLKLTDPDSGETEKLTKEK